MLHTGRRKIWQDVSGRKFRAFLVSASIFVGVLGVIALFTSSDLIRRQLQEDVQEDAIAMINVVALIESGATPDNAFYLDTLNRRNELGRSLPALEGIEIVEAQAYFFIDFKQGDTFQQAELRTYSTALQDIQLEPLRLLAGAYPTPGQGQIALEKRMAEANGFSLGDFITFRVAGAEGLQEVRYQVAGIVFHPYSNRGRAGDQPGPEVGIYAQYEDAQALLKFSGYNRFVARYATFEQAQAQFTEFVRTLDEVTPYNPVVPGLANPSQNTLVVNAGIFTSILNALALTAMVVSGFLVINVINTIIAEQKQQIGVLKSLGASTPQVFMIYAGIALSYGVLGTLCAIIPGILVAQAITAALAPTLDIVIEGFKWSPSAVVLGVVLGLIVPVLAAIIPVYNGIRLSILEAITDLGIRGRYGHGLIPRFINALPLPVTVRQALSNVYQKRWSLALTGVTLTITIATFMGTFALTVSLSTEIRALFDRLGYQVLVIPNELQEPDDVRRLIENVDGVAGTSPATIAFIQLDEQFVNFFTGDSQVQIFGLQPEDNMLVFTYTNGEGWSQNPNREGIVISTSIARQLDLQVGDSLQAVISGKPQEIEVIGIDASAFDAANMPWRYLSRLAGYIEGAPTPNQYIELAQRTEGGFVVAVGMDPVLLSYWLQGYDPNQAGVVISGDLATDAGLAIGDTLTLTIGETATTQSVVGVVPNSVLAANAAQFGSGSIPADIALFRFADLLALSKADTSGEPVPNAFYVILDQHAPNATDAAAMIEKLQVELLAQGIPARYINQVADGDRAVTEVGTRTSIFLVAALLIAIVGAIGLLTTLSISVFERQKEIGVMRSIGAGSGIIAFQFMVEGLTVGLVAWLAGLPISYGIAIAFNKVANLENVTFRYPMSVILLGLVGMLLIAALASAGPALGAARKTVSDILRYQ